MDTGIILGSIGISAALAAIIYFSNKAEADRIEEDNYKSMQLNSARICFNLPKQFKDRAIDMGLYNFDLTDLSIDDIEELIISRETDFRISLNDYTESRVSNMTIGDYMCYNLNQEASKKTLQKYFERFYETTQFDVVMNRYTYNQIASYVKL